MTVWPRPCWRNCAADRSSCWGQTPSSGCAVHAVRRRLGYDGARHRDPDCRSSRCRSAGTADGVAVGDRGFPRSHALRLAARVRDGRHLERGQRPPRPAGSAPYRRHFTGCAEGDPGASHSTTAPSNGGPPSRTRRSRAMTGSPERPGRRRNAGPMRSPPIRSTSSPTVTPIFGVILRAVQRAIAGRARSSERTQCRACSGSRDRAPDAERRRQDPRPPRSTDDVPAPEMTGARDRQGWHRPQGLGNRTPVRDPRWSALG